MAVLALRIREASWFVKRPRPGKDSPIPLLVDLLAALAGLAAALLAAEWYARSSVAPVRPALEAARAVGEAVRPHPALRRLLVRRLDRSVTTGFLLTLALACSLVGGVLLGVLVYLVRSVPALQHVDNSVAGWGYDHRTPFSTSGLHAITDLGSIQVVVGLALLLAAIDFYRTRSRWSLPFLLTVMAGMELLTLGVKDLVGRVRPALDPAAASLGPSFPSGHSATSAAFYAAAALILGRTLQRRRRQIADRARRRNRRRGRRQPRAPRPPLALRRRRRPGTRMGLVRALRRHVRRQAPEADSSRRRRRRRGSRSGKRRPSDSAAGVRGRVEGDLNERTAPRVSQPPRRPLSVETCRRKATQRLRLELVAADARPRSSRRSGGAAIRRVRAGRNDLRTDPPPPSAAASPARLGARARR